MRSLVVPGVRTWCLGFIPDGGIKIPQLVAKKKHSVKRFGSSSAKCQLLEGRFRDPCSLLHAYPLGCCTPLKKIFFWLHRTACRTWVPRPEIEPAPPPAVEARSNNHPTTSEVPARL